jgi:hypothetical protein
VLCAHAPVHYADGKRSPVQPRTPCSITRSGTKNQSAARVRAGGGVSVPLVGDLGLAPHAPEGVIMSRADIAANRTPR